ncbi:MAG TPA: hypothetical protein VIN60_00285 [Anaerolineales bacterium]
MNLDAILEVAIGLVAAWLTLSVAVSQVQEWISSWLAWRAQNLEKSILSMLQNGQMVQDFYNHPLIQSLAEPGKNRKPSYIPASTFATVMMDLFVNAGTPAGGQAAGTTTPSISQINAGIANIKQQNASLGRIMDHVFPHLSNNLVGLDQSVAEGRTNLENWYNSVQERASGWYKRSAAIWSFVFGLVIALVFNIDTVQIASQLWKAPTIRQALVAQATTTASGSVPTNALSTLLKPQDYADSLAMPFGWSTAPVTDSSIQCGWAPGQNVHPYFWAQNECNIIVNLPAMNDGWGWLAKLIGILLSGAAAAQGSPFWFNVLNKLVNLRGSGNTPATTPAPTAPVPAPAAPIPPAPSPDAPVG